MTTHGYEQWALTENILGLATSTVCMYVWSLISQRNMVYQCANEGLTDVSVQITLVTKRIYDENG